MCRFFNQIIASEGQTINQEKKTTNQLLNFFTYAILIKFRSIKRSVTQFIFLSFKKQQIIYCVCLMFFGTTASKSSIQLLHNKRIDYEN